MSAEFLKVEGLGKSFPAPRGGTPLTVFENVNFAIERGEFVCIIGHSGCGKSTILNVLAGLEEASAGVVIMNGREIAGPGLDRGVVFQGHALMPWLTAKKNVEFGVRSRWPDAPQEKIDAICERYLALVGLAETLSHHEPALEPKMLLLDEPFGALDALTRGVIQDELLKICAATHQTIFMITHDVDEAILLADKIMLMSNGPRARIAEIVVNTLPRDRSRHTIHKDPQYYAIRNHLVDFLVSRSKGFAEQPPAGYDPLHPPLVSPGLAAKAGEGAAAVRAVPEPRVAVTA